MGKKAENVEAAAVVAIQPASQPVTPVDLVRIAIDQAVDVTRLRELYELQQQWEADQARKAGIAALAEAMAECPPTIVKGGRVDYTDNSGRQVAYNHATLADIKATVNPILAKHGLTATWDVAQDDRLIAVSCHIEHRGGWRKTVTLRAGYDSSGGKNAIQSLGSTVTYLQRYTIQAALGIAAEDPDDDGRQHSAPEPRAPRRPSPEPRPEPRKQKPSAAYEAARELVRISTSLADLDRIDVGKVKRETELEDIDRRIDDKRAKLIGLAALEASPEDLERLTALLDTVKGDAGRAWAGKRVKDRRTELAPDADLIS